MVINSNALTIFQEIAEAIGVLSFAISGLIAALRKQFDVVGVSMVAGLTAFGGGTLRDVLLDRRPFSWVQNSYWLWIILLLSIIAIWVLKHKHVAYTEKMIQVPDAVGLSVGTILGTQIALQFEMPLVVCIFLGVVSATFGGVLRDVVCGDVPKLFSDHRPYAVVGFAGSLFYILLIKNDVDSSIAFCLSFLLIILFRMFSLQKDWMLPVNRT